MGQENNLQAGGRGSWSNLQAGCQPSDACQRQGTQEKDFLKINWNKQTKINTKKPHLIYCGQIFIFPAAQAAKGDLFPLLAGLNIRQVAGSQGTGRGFAGSRVPLPYMRPKTDQPHGVMISKIKGEDTQQDFRCRSRCTVCNVYMASLQHLCFKTSAPL